MSNKIKQCKVCGKDIATSAKVCPYCGAKNKKPIYKRWWFIVIIVFIVLGAVFGGGDSSEDVKTNSGTEQKEIEYTKYTVSEMISDLEDNAMAAKEKYDGQYVEITGQMDVVDSDGKYIALYPGKSDFELTSVKCYIMTDEQKEQLKNLKTGSRVTVKGKITDVGEVIGYLLDIDSIE